MTSTPDTSPHVGTPRRVGLAAAIIVGLLATAGGILAGVHWHDRIERMLGMSEASKTGTKGLWTCGMHPKFIQDHPGDCPICQLCVAACVPPP